ncbi:carboxymuconolactone decarboxylase family protein [Hyphococcus sp.]|uniref:carboxymuconolactone decarboxylase family protein n=2 Tax=Hyphococcus sp. TaxID=2038636 RepID=UPI0035C7241E
MNSVKCGNRAGPGDLSAHDRRETNGPKTNNRNGCARFNMQGRFAGLGAAVMMEGALSPELREIAALRVAYRCNAPYGLAQHQRVARQIGMSEDKVMQSQCEEGGEAFAPLEQRVLALVDVYFQAPEMVATFDFSELTDALDERQIVELLVTIGYFAMVAIFTTGLQLDV